MVLYKIALYLLIYQKTKAKKIKLLSLAEYKSSIVCFVLTCMLDNLPSIDI